MAAINVWDTDIIGGIPTDGFHGIIVASQALQQHIFMAAKRRQFSNHLD